MPGLVMVAADPQPPPPCESQICRFSAGPGTSRSMPKAARPADAEDAGRPRETDAPTPWPRLDTGRARGQNDDPKTVRRAAGLS
jgi:hypothetical protein